MTVAWNDGYGVSTSAILVQSYSVQARLTDELPESAITTLRTAWQAFPLAEVEPTLDAIRCKPVLVKRRKFFSAVPYYAERHSMSLGESSLPMMLFAAT